MPAQRRAEAVEVSTATLFGWHDEPAGIVAFVHTATIACGMVLDATASQFDPDLPDQRIAPIEECLDRPAEAIQRTSAARPYVYWQVTYWLRDQGLATITGHDGGLRMQLTDRGRQLAAGEDTSPASEED